MNRRYKNADHSAPLTPIDTTTWRVGETRLVLADGLALNVTRDQDDSFTVHHRVGVTADKLDGKLGRLRVRRGASS